ncbi:hypothetical protein FHS21_004174 [Phyllobacterium trifolii]|uniref:Uncharacterized protein n=1 Tax=Phyllobacterium trifolii TaxID=300193 RepID=A0A839UG04_9HYPH|nr:hypothetical protein [Phyllobacterium trifolii]MBB3147742.1 hypothetical protein [Phyllobacterium trifolii]
MKIDGAFRQWRWQRLPIYNGFTHEERVKGWQLHWHLIDIGYLVPPSVCSVSGSTQNVQYHSENYYEPWNPYPICRTLHLALHKRFSRPEDWKAIVQRYVLTGEEWFAKLAAEPTDLAAHLRSLHGDAVANVLDRLPGIEA